MAETPASNAPRMRTKDKRCPRCGIDVWKGFCNDCRSVAPKLVQSWARAS